jgi:hypothetical protein
MIRQVSATAMINTQAVPALPVHHQRIVSPVSPFKDFADPLALRRPESAIVLPKWSMATSDR